MSDDPDAGPSTATDEDASAESSERDDESASRADSNAPSEHGGESPGSVDDRSDETETPVDPDAVEEYTTSVRTLDSRVRTLWMLRAVVFGLVVGLVLTVIAYVVTPRYFFVGSAIGLLVVLVSIGHAHLLYRSWEYRVRADSMYLDRGVLTKVQTVVPYVRVQHIDTSRGPLERAFGLSSLVVYTAGSRGADVTVPGLTPEEATDLQTRLKALAIESEGEDAV